MKRKYVFTNEMSNLPTKYLVVHNSYLIVRICRPILFIIPHFIGKIDG